MAIRSSDVKGIAARILVENESELGYSSLSKQPKLITRRCQHACVPTGQQAVAAQHAVDNRSPLTRSRARQAPALQRRASLSAIDAFNRAVNTTVSELKGQHAQPVVLGDPKAAAQAEALQHASESEEIGLEYVRHATISEVLLYTALCVASAIMCAGHQLTCMYAAARTCSASVLAGQSAWQCRTVCSHVRQRRPRCSSNEAVATKEAVTTRTNANANANAKGKANASAGTVAISPSTQHLYNARRPSRYHACSAKQHRDAACHSSAHRASRRLV